MSRTFFVHKYKMVPSEENCHQKLDYPRIPVNEEFSSSAGPEIQTPSSEQGSVGVDRVENDPSSVMKLLEESRQKFQNKFRLHFNKLYKLKAEVQLSLCKMNLTMHQNLKNLHKGLSIENSIHEYPMRTFDSIVDSDCSDSRLTPTKEYVTGWEDEDLMPAQIAQFVNWQKLWCANLFQEIQSHLDKTSREIRNLIAKEAARMDQQMKDFQNKVLQPQHMHNLHPPPSLLVEGSQPDGVYGYHNRKKESAPNSIDKPYSDTLELIDELDDSCDRISTSTPSTETNRGQIAEPKVLCIPIASISPESPSSIGNTSGSSPCKKLQQIFTVLTRKQEDQSLSTVSNAEEIRSQRATAKQNIEQLWMSIETHPLEVLPIHDCLCEYMKTFVVLSLIFEDKKLFYDHTLNCAQQLRNPENVDELAVVTTSTDASRYAAPPFVDWSAYKSSTSQYLVLLSPQDKQFFREVASMEPTTLVIWCSAYACLLLRLGDRGASYVRHQLAHLNRQLAEAYRLDEKSLPKMPLNSSSFDQRLRKYSNYAVDPLRRNTLFKGLIERYECSGLPERTKKFLNFLLLKSLRYRGMSLITLVDECRKLYQLSLDELVESTLADQTKDSWHTYKRFVSTFINGDQCKMYKYCQVFHPQMYSDLHFNANYNLCFLLCVLIDIRKLKGGCEPVLYHRTVKKLRVNGDGQLWMDATWKQKFVQIVKKFVNY